MSVKRIGFILLIGAFSALLAACQSAVNEAEVAPQVVVEERVEVGEADDSIGSGA